jgi:hypothetical protein
MRPTLSIETPAGGMRSVERDWGLSSSTPWTLPSPQIVRLPRAGTRVPRVPIDLPVRRAPVKRFPYHVIYLDLKATIRVLAVAHDRRRPVYWKSRL